MSEVLLFHHIPKTAGSTMKHVLWATFGGKRVLFSMGFHDSRVPDLRRQLDGPLDRFYAVVAHTGYGVQDRLPDRHAYSMFTILRDPVQRTISEYFFARDRGRLPAGTALETFLEEDVLRSYNAQTAFLGGLSVRHHLDGLPLRRGQFDRGLLEQAKRNLETHDVVGLTERFDETLLLLRATYGWPLFRTFYRPDNVGVGRRGAPQLSRHELEAVRDNNELDIELYEFGRGLLDTCLAKLEPEVDRQLRRYRRLNHAYQHSYPVTNAPVRALVRSARRLRDRSRVVA